MDYQQTNVSGVRWRRFSNISINNPLNATPVVSCAEQEVVSLSSDAIAYGVGTLEFPFDPGFVFPLLDPLTNEPTGATAAGAAVYQLVYSYVLAKAMERDAKAAEEGENRAEAMRLSAAYLAQQPGA